MPSVVNNNLRMIDRPVFEQLTFGPANTAAGVCIADDGARYIYAIYSATSFWRYCTWSDTWQQLANPNAFGAFGAGTNIRFVKSIGSQVSGVVYGSIFMLLTSGTGAAGFQRYDIANNTWTSLSNTNLPATFGTDGKFAFPEPFLNNFEGGYHAAGLSTITATAAASLSATSITVSALPIALAANTVLNFGTAAAPKWAVLTAAAAASATSITVAPLLVAISGSETALYYNSMYLIGNNATAMYRYSVNTNAWSTTNVAAAALPALPGAAGAACTLKWLPGSDLNSLWAVRGGATNSIYKYDLGANTWSTFTYNPATETFTTGSSYGIVNVGGKASVPLIHKEVTNRIYRLNIPAAQMQPQATQYLFTQGAAVVGDKSVVIPSPEGVMFYYLLLSTSNVFVRTALFF